MKLRPNETLNLHVFLDRSVMEVFVNNRLCLTHRLYPTRDDSKGVAFFARGGAIRIPKLDARKCTLRIHSDHKFLVFLAEVRNELKTKYSN